MACDGFSECFIVYIPAIIGIIGSIGGSFLLIRFYRHSDVKDYHHQMMRSSAILIYRMGKVYRDVNGIIRNAYINPNTPEEEGDRVLHNQIHEQFTLYVINNRNTITKLLSETKEQIRKINEPTRINSDLKQMLHYLDSAQELLIWFNDYFIDTISDDIIPEDSIFPESIYNEDVSWKQYHKTFLDQVQKISDINTKSAHMVKA